MTLAAEYGRQFEWRSWSTVLDELPSLAGRSVLDLGCGVGDQAAALVARGARVIGIDANLELIAAARAKRLPNAEFRAGDLRTLAVGDFDAPVDGIWCSLVPAYFVDLAGQLAAWRRLLRPGGWIALTEIDDLFAHEPLGARTRELLDAYMQEARRASRYDFQMGRRIGSSAEQAGFHVTQRLTLADQEFSFTGPARPDVLRAWRQRFARLTALRDVCGPEFDEVVDDFLHCLSRAGHRSQCQVHGCIAISPTDAESPDSGRGVLARVPPCRR